jgi:hypothetical protein
MARSFIIGAALLALQVSVPAPEIKGARVTVVSRTAATMSVTVENRRDSPLVELQIAIPGAKGKGSQVDARFFHDQPYGIRWEPGPIQPNERRTLEVRNSVDGEVAEMWLAVFEDGYVEGVAGALDGWRTTHRERTDDLAYWVGVLDTMPRISEPDVRKYLADRVVDRARQAVPNASDIRARVQRALQENASRSGTVWSVLDRLRVEARSELAVLQRQTQIKSAASPGAIASVAFSFRRAVSTEYTAAVENLRDVPIEAFGLDVMGPDSGRASGQWLDFCTTDPEPIERGHGRIQPREVREVPLHVSAKSGAPVARLSVVLFDDLSFEGLSDQRERLLRDRETQAADYAFAIDVIAKAAALPPNEMRPFLAVKRGERAAQLGGDGRAGNVSAIDEFARLVTDSPDQADAIAKGMVPRLERQRRQLIRHVRR